LFVVVGVAQQWHNKLAQQGLGDKNTPRGEMSPHGLEEQSLGKND
jgi:hypothetical protein